MTLQVSCAAGVQSELSLPSHSRLILWEPDIVTKLNIVAEERCTYLVVELGEPVMQGHLAGASDHQLAQRHPYTDTLSAKLS